MNKLYIIERFITVPGALVRGFFEQLVCRLCGIPVEDNRILRNDELNSHIEHELAPTSRKAFIICFLPAFLNGILATLLFLPSFINLFYLQTTNTVYAIIYIVAYYFAFSLYVNSYPTVEDALNMKYQVYHGGNILQKIFYSISFPFLYIGAYAEKYSITFLIALAEMAGLIAIAVA